MEPDLGQQATKSRWVHCTNAALWQGSTVHTAKDTVLPASNSWRETAWWKKIRISKVLPLCTCSRNSTWSDDSLQDNPINVLTETVLKAQTTMIFPLTLQITLHVFSSQGRCYHPALTCTARAACVLHLFRPSLTSTKVCEADGGMVRKGRFPHISTIIRPLKRILILNFLCVCRAAQSIKIKF